MKKRETLRERLTRLADQAKRGSYARRQRNDKRGYVDQGRAEAYLDVLRWLEEHGDATGELQGELRVADAEPMEP